METSYLQGGGLMSIGDPITATRIGVAIVPLFQTHNSSVFMGSVLDLSQIL